MIEVTNENLVFDNLPVKDVILWTTLITGYVEHEHCEEYICTCFSLESLW